MTLEDAEFPSSSASKNKNYASEKENFRNQINTSIAYAYTEDYDIMNMKNIDSFFQTFTNNG